MSTSRKVAPEADAWAAGAREMTGQNWTTLIVVIDKLLHGEASPQGTAESLASLLGPEIRKQSQGTGNSLNIGTLWQCLGHAARRCGHKKVHAVRLAELVLSIAALDDQLLDDGKPVVNVEGLTYWKDLPWFHVSIRDYIASEWSSGPELQGEDQLERPWQDQAQPILGATRFLGELLNRSNFTQTNRESERRNSKHLAYAIVRCLDLSGIWSEMEVQLPAGKLEERLDQRYHMITVMSAATMVLVAGEKIWQLCQSGLPVPGSNCCYDQKQWHLWRSNFAARSDVLVFPLEARELCERAATHMESINGN